MEPDKLPMQTTVATVPWLTLLAALFAGLLVAGAIGLWAYVGTTVFFEMVRTGWMACF